MTIPQSNPQPKDELDGLIADLSREVDRTSGRASPAGRPSPGGLRQAPGGPQLWGPTSRRDTSPLEMLVQAADDAHWLLAEVNRVVANITGEEPPTPRLRAVPRAGGGLLPTVGHLAHEIETSLGEIALRLKELGAKL
jgi:hypothetical protein